MTRPDHDGKRAGGERGISDKDLFQNLLLVCRLESHATVRNLVAIIRQHEALSFAAGIEAAAKLLHEQSYDFTDGVAAVLRCQRDLVRALPLPAQEREKP